MPDLQPVPFSGMTRLSVNINKIALWRNSRPGNFPDIEQVATDCERFGAQGITVHPRPDGRHIRYQDVVRLKNLVQTELNVEGYPSADFLQLIESVKPAQVTLVPDPPEALTSSAGWDTLTHKAHLRQVVQQLQSWGCRVSLFVEPDELMVVGAAETGTDRIEFYTGPYAAGFSNDPEAAISAYIDAAERAIACGLGIHAGHDLNIENLSYWCSRIPQTLEVSIGHALWADALYLGMENTIRLYLRATGA
jgi:pyridoxine 5-phosphate synthase